MENTVNTRARTPSDWVGLVVLSLIVLFVGAVLMFVVPLLTLACAACQDGVLGPLRYGDVQVAVAQGVVPVVALGTVGGMLHPRGGARVAAIGLALLGVLLCVMLALGQVAA
ncbi:hypothetical protein ACWCRF_04870 [Streptomyces sp. NPDC002405]|uniref:hypothetical protein n=1 Tax=Streptomyces sp. NPDC001231 TaxID=3364549 RepID=UPI0036C76A6E